MLVSTATSMCITFGCVNMWYVCVWYGLCMCGVCVCMCVLVTDVGLIKLKLSQPNPFYVALWK